MKKFSLLLACCFLAYAAVAFYNPQMGRWMTRDPIEEANGPNLYAFCANAPVNSIDLLGLKRWIMFYYSAQGQDEFRRAAETAKRDIESDSSFNPKCDAVILKGASTVAEFQAAWGAAQSETSGSAPELKVEAAHLFTHSGPGVVYMRGDSMNATQIQELPKLNWAENGRVVAHGCNSGIWNGKKESVAGSFAKGQGVAALGQSGFSQFSERQDRRTLFSRVGADSRSVYLWSYGDGGRKWTFGDARQPNVFGLK